MEDDTRNKRNADVSHEMGMVNESTIRVLKCDGSQNRLIIKNSCVIHWALCYQWTDQQENSFETGRIGGLTEEWWWEWNELTVRAVLQECQWWNSTFISCSRQQCECHFDKDLVFLLTDHSKSIDSHQTNAPSQFVCLCLNANHQQCFCLQSWHKILRACEAHLGTVSLFHWRG